MLEKQYRQILKMQFQQSVKILSRYNEIRVDGKMKQGGKIQKK